MMKRILMMATALTLSLGLSACEEEQCTFFIPPPSSRPGLFLVNEQVKLPLQSLVENTCAEDGRTVSATGISAEIHDPDQLPVEHQAILNRDGQSATLEFTPLKQGRYHILAAFEPVGGIHQFDAYAAVDRSAEAPLHLLPRECTSLERTRKGTFVCGLEFWRGGGVPVLQLPSGRLAVSGNTVWHVDTGEISHYVDTGEAIERTSGVAHTAGPPEALLATETELVVLHANKIQRFVFDGQAVTLTGDSLWAPPAGALRPGGPRGIMVRTGDRLAIISSSVFSPGGSQLQSCTFQLDQGRFLRTAESCARLPGVVVGFEPSVLWLGEDAASFTIRALNRMEWTGTQWLMRGSLDLGQVLNMPIPTHNNLNGSNMVPVVESPQVTHRGAPRIAVPVYVPGQPQLSLDFLDATVLRAQASSSLFWGTSTVGTPFSGRIRLRPSTP